MIGFNAPIQSLSGRKIKNDIAITGEIDLCGKIMPIGGLESKIFGAKAAGAVKVLCPHDNKDCLNRIMKEHPNIIEKWKIESKNH